jgi:hypothetical protein
MAKEIGHPFLSIGFLLAIGNGTPDGTPPSKVFWVPNPQKRDDLKYNHATIKLEQMFVVTSFDCTIIDQKLLYGGSNCRRCIIELESSTMESNLESGMIGSVRDTKVP